MSDIKLKGLRIRKYENNQLNSGRVATVWLDQYGRVMERVRDRKTGKEDWQPTGECGTATHQNFE